MRSVHLHWAALHSAGWVVCGDRCVVVGTSVGGHVMGTGRHLASTLGGSFCRPVHHVVPFITLKGGVGWWWCVRAASSGPGDRLSWQVCVCGVCAYPTLENYLVWSRWW
jgi:hypothetical protein